MPSSAQVTSFILYYSIFPQLPFSLLLDPMSQTMLLTKPLTTFLSQNASPQLPTLLLISPTGKLLSSSSPLPASILRTQSTVACTMWNLYNPFQTSTSSRVNTSLPPGPTSLSSASTPDLSSITIQLSHGTMVIRSLSCGLLFVAIGPSITPTTAPTSHHLLFPPHIASSHTSPQASPPTHHDLHDGLGERVFSGGSLAIGSGAPSEAGSVGSSVTGARTHASILGIKRQAEEVGRWLETSLQGFVLSTGEGR
ncbi:hypothetical protein LCER1_G005352 [Lachnellula cervina]|uniref:Uncharacterized protein n=1 Tax=Lachnellula cervina TaxID=1316786 RepID=A0A7D8YMS2_9HELO|nr:hypothetical protein LCER1_G005352 [Lachnellula cervina]